MSESLKDPVCWKAGEGGGISTLEKGCQPRVEGGCGGEDTAGQQRAYIQEQQQWCTVHQSQQVQHIA